MSEERWDILTPLSLETQWSINRKRGAHREGLRASEVPTAILPSVTLH
jgi:hypothetical protein